MQQHQEIFDVLVVYSHRIATSASSTNTKDTLPFAKGSGKENYNNAYAYFLKVCKKNKLRAAFTTSKDLLEDKSFSSYWTFEKDVWKKINKHCTSTLIFDKFSPINSIQKNRHASLFATSEVRSLNNSEIKSLFFDKQLTFDRFTEFTIPTVTVKRRSEKGIAKALKDLSALLLAHPNREDFSNEIIIKDRFGAGGESVFRVGGLQTLSKISEILDNDKITSFVLQPFAKFDKGYKLGKFKGFVDIRIVYMGTSMIQAYIRTAAKDDFRCNMHQGGNVIYIIKKDIPARIIRLANEILKELNDTTALVALDFIISNNGNPYLMEGNSGPGLNWSMTIKEDEKYTKKLIREIVKVILLRVNEELEDHTRKNISHSHEKLISSLQVAI